MRLSTWRWQRFLTAAIALSSFTTLAGTARGAVVINEIDYDQPGTDTGEYIELFNNGASAVSLSGYTLRLVNGANNTTYQTITIPATATLPAGGYYVICGDATVVPNCQLDVTPNSDLIQNGSPDALSLLLNGVVLDSLSYEGDVPGNTEGSGVPTASAENNNAPNLSLSRCANGVDTDNNANDFKAVTPTPGAANACGTSSGSVGACGDPATKISAIQGSGLSSPLVGSIANVEAVVVGDFQDRNINGFYLQEEDSDADTEPETSEGLFIFEGSSSVAVSAGNVVRVRGTVAESSGLTELTSITDVIVCPGVPQVTAASVTFPLSAVTDLERYEGMLVHIPQPLTVTGNFDLGRFGSLDLSVGGRLFEPTHLALPGIAASAQADLNDRSRIILDDASSAQDPAPIPYKDANNTRRLGDTLPSLTGILSGEFGAYRIHPTGPITFTSGNPRPVAPAPAAGRLRIAAMNVLNFFTTLDTGGTSCGPTGGLGCRGANTTLEFDRQRGKLLNALQALNGDIVGLMEIENNASAAVQSLVDGLNSRLGAGTYAFVNTGTIGTDAIKLALIYKPSKVTPTGAHAILNSAVNPSFVDTKNRPSLAQTFTELASNGRLTVVVNHLKSKGSACDDIGDADLGDGQGNCNATRTAAAHALLNWIATDPTHSSDPDYLLLGDFNAYAKEDPISVLKSGLTSLIETRIGSGAYSFQFEGQVGYLDHAFVSSSLDHQIVDASEWHINADEPSVIDYNTEFKTDDPFNPADPFGASDHDPILVSVNLDAAPPPVPALRGAQTLAASLLLLGIGAICARRRRPQQRWA